MAAAFAILLALLRAFPAAESLLRDVIAQRDGDREREAQMRLQEKDARVDAAIDGPKKS